MLKKLIKYEWKAMRWHYAVPFLVYIAAFVFSMVLIHWHPVAAGFIVFGGLFVLAIWMFMTFFRRYNANLYGSEGYLMFTLPVRSRELLFSKILVSFLWLTLYLILTAAVILLTALSLAKGIHIEQFPAIGEILKVLGAHIGSIVLMLLYYIVGVVACILDIYFAITVSKLAIWRRFSVFMGFMAFVALNLVRSIPIWLVGYFFNISASNQIVHLEFSGNRPVINFSLTMGFWVMLAYTAAFAVGIFFLTAWVMKKHTSLK